MDVRVYANPWDEENRNATGYAIEALRRRFEVHVTTEADPYATRPGELVILRHDIPVRPSLLEHLPASARYLNEPAAILRYSTKEHLTEFPDLTVPTYIGRDRGELETFIDEHDRVVLKPLAENSGTGIEVASASDEDLDTHLDAYLSSHDRIVAQRYIEGVERLGDKRINVIGYEPVSAALRLPADGSFICNIGSGGHAVPAAITDTDRRTVERIAPWLEENGLRWVGIDLIGPYLTEINVVSPGMLEEADELNGNDHGARSLTHLVEELTR